MHPRKQRQHGAMLLVIVAILMMLALSMLIGRTGEIISAKGARVSATLETESAIQKALISFTSTYQRLPCPAAPTGGTNPGWPDDVKPLALPAALICVYPTGIVPWNALGLTQAQVTDEWGRMISYRVFDGSTGLTQNNGSSALNCASNILPLTASAVVATPNGLCDETLIPLKRTAAQNFIADAYAIPPFIKGFLVNDFGTSVSNVAFVLISHGPSGLGGYLPSGNRMPMPGVLALDYPNTQFSPGPYVRQAVSDPSIAAGAVLHNDDVVTYITISELLKLANQDARNWP